MVDLLWCMIVGFDISVIYKGLGRLRWGDASQFELLHFWHLL